MQNICVLLFLPICTIFKVNDIYFNAAGFFPLSLSITFKQNTAGKKWRGTSGGLTNNLILRHTSLSDEQTSIVACKNCLTEVCQVLGSSSPQRQLDPRCSSANGLLSGSRSDMMPY